MHARTVAGWFRLTNTKDRGTNWMTIVAYGPNATGRRFNLNVGEHFLGVEFCLSCAVAAWEHDSKWHHLAAVVPQNCSRQNQIEIYLDGVRLRTATYTGVPPLDPIDGSKAFDTGSAPLKVGQAPDVDYVDQREGRVREIRIYDRALSPNEIAILHSNPARATNQGLVLGFHCDEGSGKTVADFSGHGNNGTLHGNMQWVSVPNQAKSINENTPETASATEKIAQERITTLEALVRAIDEKHRAGLASWVELYEAQDALLHAQLDAAKSPSTRVAIWEKLLNIRQNIEKQIEARVEAGVEGGGTAKMLRAKAARQQAEIGFAGAKEEVRSEPDKPSETNPESGGPSSSPGESEAHTPPAGDQGKVEEMRSLKRSPPFKAEAAQQHSRRTAWCGRVALEGQALVAAGWFAARSEALRFSCRIYAPGKRQNCLRDCSPIVESGRRASGHALGLYAPGRVGLGAW